MVSARPGHQPQAVPPVHLPPLVPNLTARGLVGALSRYRLMAYLVGVGLLVLVLVGMPLQYGAHYAGVVAVVGPLHGGLYIVYLLAGTDLARRSRLTLVQLLLVIVAGFVPGVAFVVERWVARRVAARLPREAAQGPVVLP